MIVQVIINGLGVRLSILQELRVKHCYFSSWQWEASSGLCLNAGPDCLLLAVLLLEAIVSQSSLDGIFCQHWEDKGIKG